MKLLTDIEITRREQYVLDTLAKVAVANTRILFNTADLNCALVNIQRAFDEATNRNSVTTICGYPIRIMKAPDWTDRRLSKIIDEMRQWDFDNEPYFPLTETEMDYCARHLDIETKYVLEDNK